MSILFFTLACICVHGHKVLLVFLMKEKGYGRMFAHLFHAQFGFKLSSIFMDQEIMSKSRLLQETIFMFWFRASEGYLWLLLFVCY